MTNHNPISASYDFTQEELSKMGYTASRKLPDGTILAVGPMLGNNGRLFIDIHPNGYEDCYCYDSLEAAHSSMMNYNPQTDKEPEGWKRHPFTGRRRPSGDASKEYIAM